MIDRLIRETQNAWHLISSDERLPKNDQFELITLSGQGATSNTYLMNIREHSGVTNQLFIKHYGLSVNRSEFWTKQLQTDYLVLQTLSQLSDMPQGFNFPAPLFIIPDEQILVTRFVKGKNLGKLFSKALKFSCFKKNDYSYFHNITSRIGKALVMLQKVPVSLLSPTLYPVEPTALQSVMIGNFMEWSSLITESGYPSGLISECELFLEETLGKHFLNGFIPSFQHTDLILQNIMVDECGDLYLFDFPNSCIGSPYMDIAHFIGSLDDLSYLVTVSKKEIDSLVCSFLESVQSNFRIDPEVLAAFLLYIQFYSTRTILSIIKANPGLSPKTLLLESPERRFRHNTKEYLAKDLIRRWLA
jgi:hypothetical protein